MRPSVVGAAISLLSYSAGVAAQTSSDCNPLQDKCPPRPALGRSAEIDFTEGRSDDFTEVGTPSYDENGVGFTVANQGDAPLIQSKWYIMFGRVECVLKTAPGTGIVSSAVLQSDDLDEIDWEWLGINDLYVQTNYFGKGNTGTYNRGATHDNNGNHDEYHTYTIDWTSKQIVWQIDGQTVRSLTPKDTEDDQYPQSPMMVKIGVWAGGDPNNAQGTIQWAGGEADYSAGPYTMYLQSLKVTDYSTGSSYSYGDNSGSWQSIVAEGGEVEGNDDSEPKSTLPAPPVTSTVGNIPVPWAGTHRETSSFVTPNIWPWVATPTSSTTSKMTSLPSGWEYSGSGAVHPPSASSFTDQYTSASSVLLPAPSSLSGTSLQPSRNSVTLTTTTSSSSSTSSLSATSFTTSTCSTTAPTSSTDFTSSSAMSSRSTSSAFSQSTASSDDSSSTSTATAKGHDQPSFTGLDQVAPTVSASSHTVTASTIRVACALLGSLFALF